MLYRAYEQFKRKILQIYPFCILSYCNRLPIIKKKSFVVGAAHVKCIKNRIRKTILIYIFTCITVPVYNGIPYIQIIQSSIE